MEILLSENKPPTARYAIGERIAEGGMGELRRVRDHRLERTVVRKFLLWDYLHNDIMHERFEREALLMARLQHPGIPPVHDRGVGADGRPWLVMREVRGTTLNALLLERENARLQGKPESLSLRTLIGYLVRVAETVAYAHSLGVVHRDLKPDNIMIGEFGLVQVIDWGVAGFVDPKSPFDQTIAALPATYQGRLTIGAQGLGTDGYMPPEQQQGAAPATTMDVYALGVMLFELLAGKTPEHSGLSSLNMDRLEGIQRAVTRPCPADLLPVVWSCLRSTPADRLRDAGEVAAALTAWLDGARRRDEANRVIESAIGVWDEILRSEQEGQQLVAQALEVFDRLQQEQVLRSPEKERAWQTEDRGKRLLADAEARRNQLLLRLEGVLLVDADNERAHEELCVYWKDELLRAEALQDIRRASVAEQRLRHHDRGQHTAWLVGGGRLALLSHPPGASVELFAFEEHRRCQEAVRRSSLGKTPLEDATVPTGSHLLILKHPERESVLVPVALGRGEHYCDPDGRPIVVQMPEQGALRTDEAQVPAGWCWLGGDPYAIDSLPRVRVWVDGFVMQRDPVTNAQYLVFLNTVLQTQGEEAALKHVPRNTRSGAGAATPAAMFPRDESGSFVLPDAELAWHADAPVAQVTWWDALAYAAWWSQQTGQSWRLPHAVEREKAARGADGRFWPWGNTTDVTWFCNGKSHLGVPRRMPVSHDSCDVSVYGIRGLSGNVRDWCHNLWERRPAWWVQRRLEVEEASIDSEALREIRGGAWSAQPPFCRPASRFALPPGDRLGSGGFRLVRSW